jgi:hypothetical protein
VRGKCVAGSEKTRALQRGSPGVIVGGMRVVGICSCIFVATLATACGGGEPPAASPSATSSDPNEGAPIPTASDNEAKAAPSDTAKPASPPSSDASVAPPNFKENGSVLEAINAVPQGTPRLNIEQEELGRPLGNVDLYEPCKPGSAHFKAKVAVWDGKAVGIDLSTTPKNQKLADCLAARIRSLTWPDKVKSLNTVEYTF